MESPTTAQPPAKASPRTKPGRAQRLRKRPSSIQPSSPLPELSSQSLPPCQRGDWGIESPVPASSPLGMWIRTPPPLRWLREAEASPLPPQALAQFWMSVDRGKAAERGNGGQGADGRVHEDRLAICAEHHFVGVHIAGDVADSWPIEALAGHEQAHGSIDQPLGELELGCCGGLAWIRLASGRRGAAEEDQPVGAVGGEGKRAVQHLQPGALSRRCRDRHGEGWGQRFQQGGSIK